MIQMKAERPINKKDIKMVLDCFIVLTKECVRRGIRVSLPRLGVFKLKEMKGFTRRKFWNCITKEIDYSDYPAHNLPDFKPSKLWYEEIKTATWGDPL